MSEKIPMENDLDFAHLYALEKLCKEIPNILTFRNGDVNFDRRMMKCRFTKQGCNPTPRNPFSRKLYNDDGTDIDFKKTSGGAYKELWEMNEPDFLVWRKNKSGVQACRRGNFLLQNWCENPKSRSENGKKVAGVTDVPKFTYFVDTQGNESCEVPKEYCKDKGQSYSSSKKKCFVPDGQAALEFVTGTTLVRSARVSDKKLKTNRKIFKENYGGKGIHLYTFTWTEQAKLLYGNEGDDVGFLADEIEQLGSNCVYKDMNGYKTINFNCLEQKNMKRIVNFLNIKKDIWKKFNSL